MSATMMFDTVQIGKRIAKMRKEKNLTQMALADEVGTSFQAVSNWERGLSMPDVSKLPQLAALLGTTVDALLGGGGAARLVSEAAAGNAEAYARTEKIPVEDVVPAVPLLAPDQAGAVVEQVAERADSELDFSALISLAPFLSDAQLASLAVRIAGKATVGQLAGLAPFLNEDTLGRMVEKCLADKVSVGELAGLAPFLSDDTLEGIAQRSLADGVSLGELAAIAPFMQGDALDALVLRAADGGADMGSVAALAPFLSSEGIGKLVEKLLTQKNTAVLRSIAPFV